MQVRQAADKKLIYILNYVHAADVQHFVHVLNLLQALRDRGWVVELLSEKGGRGTRDVQGQRVTYLSQEGRWSRIPRMIAVLIGLRRQGFRLVFVRISQPAAIVAATLGKLIGLRTLYWQSGTVHDFDARQPWFRRLVSGFRRRVLIAGVDRFVTGPEFMLDYYEKVYGVPRNKLLLLYNDIDLSRFHPAIRPPVQAPLRVLLVHRFSPVRQTTFYFPSLIDKLSVFAASCPIEFILIGEGPEVPELKDQAAMAGPGLIVRFLGALPNAELQDHYAQAHVFVMPSYREGFPRVIIEAMAMGLPIASTDAGGTRDLVGPGQGKFIVSRDDPVALADKLIALLEDADARRRVGHENLERVQRFSTGNVADMYDRTLEALL